MNEKFPHIVEEYVLVTPRGGGQYRMGQRPGDSEILYQLNGRVQPTCTMLYATGNAQKLILIGRFTYSPPRMWV